MSENYKAALFDMDGLMLDTERIYIRVQRDAAAQLGYEVSDALLHSFVGVSGEECMRRMQEAAGEGFPMGEFRVLWYQMWRQQVTDKGIPLKAGLNELLTWLASNQVPRAVVTSTHRADAEVSLEAAGVRDQFAHAVTGDEVMHNKPAPDIYLLGAERLGIQPSRCIALEDSDAGVLSAAAAGMRVVMVPDIRQPSAEARKAAYAIVPSLREAKPLLQEWISIDK